MNAFRLAWLNLRHQRVRTTISVAGVAFTVILVFMQLGFLGAVDQTATLLYDHLDFDLLLFSSEYLDFSHTGSFPRARLAQARAVAGVQDVLPLTVSGAAWRDPRPRSNPRLTPRRWGITVLGIEPSTLAGVFRHPVGDVFGTPEELAARRAELARLGTVLIDRRSRPEYGAPADHLPGASNELNDTRVEILGEFEVGTGFNYSGLLLTSEQTLAHITGSPVDRVTFGLLKLAPGADERQTRAALAQILPKDVQVYSRDEVNAKERAYWLKATSVGQFFTLGVVIALAVGAIFVYQMIASDIRGRLPEYATAKAMGYTNRYLSHVVLSQSILLALVGYLPGLVSALGFYELTRRSAHLPIHMPISRTLVVLVFTVVMCLCSGLLALHRARASDPAELF